MSVRHSCRHVESGIGNSVKPGRAVVVRNVFHQPLDGVVGVGALVYVLGALFVLVRRHFDERSVALIAAAHVLIDKDEPVLHEAWRRPETLRIVVRAVRGDAIGSPLDQEWKGLGRRSILGYIDRREQLRAVAHNNPIFVFCVVLTNLRNGLLILLRPATLSVAWVLMVRENHSAARPYNAQSKGGHPGFFAAHPFYALRFTRFVDLPSACDDSFRPLSVSTLPAAQTLLNHFSLLVLTCALQGATLRSYLTLKEPRLSRLAPAIPDSEVDHDRSHRYLHRPTGKSE